MNGVNELTNEIINFNVKQLTVGIQRLVHKLPE